MSKSLGQEKQEYLLSLGIKACVIGFLWFATSASAQPDLSPRMQIGINLIPAVIAANKNLARHLNYDSNLPVYLAYKNNRRLALIVKSQLDNISNIRGYPLEVKVITVQEALEQRPSMVAAVFLIEKLNKELGDLLKFIRSRKAILFSPFKGDVERGVMSGFQVTDKVLPMINLRSIRNSEIELKPFFLRIAVKYE